MIFNNAGFVCLEGNMKTVVDTNSTLILNVPNFCINDPYFKKEFAHEEEVPERILNVYFYYIFSDYIDICIQK